MRKKFLKNVLSAVILLFAFCLQGCQSENRNDGYKFVVGMSQCNLYEPWRIAMNNDIKKEALKYPDMKIVYRDAGGDPQKQANDVMQLLKSGIDLLIVSMDDMQTITPVIKEASKTVPVIMLSRTIKSNDFSLCIGSDGQEVGRIAGNMIKDLLPDKKGNIIEIQGNLESATTTGRSLGLREALQSYNKIKISRTLICNWQLDETEEDVLQSVREDDSKIDVVLAYSDYMAQGAYNAVKKLGLKGVKIIGIDGLNSYNGGIELVKKGILQGTIVCPTGGKEAVDYSVKILNKEKNMPAAIILKNYPVTEGSVEDYIKANPTN